MKIHDELIKFLEGGQRNAWLRAGQLEVYVREARRYVHGGQVRTLDVANAVLHTPGPDYLQFILGLPELLKNRPSFPQAIFIESVLLPHLEVMFKRLGYTRIEGANPPCFIRWVA